MAHLRTTAVALGVLAAAGLAGLTLVPSASADTSLAYTGVVSDYTTLPSRPGGSGQQPGDQQFWVTNLYKGSRQVGRSPHHCTAVTATDTLCTSVVDLPDGQISLQALLTASSGSTLTVPVTGGSGRYRGAAGEVRVVVQNDGTQDWTIRLVTP